MAGELLCEYMKASWQAIHMAFDPASVRRKTDGVYMLYNTVKDEKMYIFDNERQSICLSNFDSNSSRILVPQRATKCKKNVGFLNVHQQKVKGVSVNGIVLNL